MEREVIEIEDDDKFILSEDEMNRQKKLLAKSLFGDATKHISNIKKRNEKQNDDKLNKINFIIKKAGNKFGDEENLMELAIDEVDDIYNIVLNQKKNIIKKIFQIFKQ